MLKGFSIAIGAAFFGLAHTAALAVPIVGLVNTGVAAAGGLLADGVQDTKYSLVEGGTASTNGYGFAQTSIGGFPIGPWLADNTTSRWLTPEANAAASFDPASPATYTWTLKFDLTNYVASTASFSARWSADNGGTVSLNGVSLGVHGDTAYSSWSAFSAAGPSFVSGVNELVFTVTNLAQNGGNPTGLRVEFVNSNVTAVPEPETYAMMLAGLGIIGFVARRRRIG